MYNKKILSKAVSELGKAKAPAKAKDIITDPMGQWKYPGLPTRIPGNDITMKGVGYPVLGVANNGQRKIMLPGADYTFPGAKYVDEYPQMKKGGAKKRKTKSLSGTNKIMQKNPLFKNYKSKMYDPNVDYFQEGGTNYNFPERDLYEGEDEYFRNNPHVGGMAAEDNYIIINPYSKLNDEERDAIRRNESARLAMRNGHPRPEFNLTPEQKEAFKNYSQDEQDQKETLVGRVISGDPSAGEITPEQQQYANQLSKLIKLSPNLKNTSGPRNNIIHDEEYEKGGPQNNASEERFKKRLMKRYPGMQGVYGTEGENLSIIKDPNYKASDYGFGNIEFMFPGQDSVTYTDDYQYKNPTPDQYTTVYNPKGANRGDVFLDMMHGMRDDEEYQKLLQNFAATVKKGRGRDMDHWYNVAAQENPNYVQDGREVWDNNYIDGILRAELANKTIGRRTKENDYNLERKGSTDEMRQAAKDIKKYLKTPQKPKQYAGPVVENNGFITPEYEDGGSINLELTEDEIDHYVKGGYIVEDISVPELNQAQKGIISTKEHTDKKGNKTIVVTKDDGTKYTKVISKDGKVYNKTQAGLSPEMRAYDKKKAEWEDRSSGAAQPVDDFWTLPIGMSSAGVKGTIGLVKGLTSLGRNAAKSSLVQTGKAGLKKSLIKSLPGSSINNSLASWFAGTALTDVVTGEVAEPWKKANKSGKFSDYADAVAENIFTVLNAYPLYGVTGKSLKQLGKYLTEETALKNAYKHNLWAFKANPKAYYHRSPNLENIVNRKTGTLQGFGNSKAGIEFSKDAGPGGTGSLAIRGDGSVSTINLKKPANSQLYFAKGVPLDGGRYNKVLNKKTGKLIDGQKYEGPYMVEVEGVPMGSSTKGRKPGAEPLGIGGYAVPRRPISLDEAKFYKEHWWQGYKQVEVPKQLPGSPNAVDFSKYLTQEEAIAARTERLISQKNKPGWDEQLTPDLEQRLSTAVENHNPASDYAGEGLGANTMGRTATEVSRHPMNADKLNPNSRTYDPNAVPIYLNDANKARIAAHETGHYYSNSPAEGKEWVSHFDFSKLSQKTRDYLMGKGWKARNTDYANEVRERAAQLKDYIAQKNGIPLNQDFTITESMLDDAITNYIKDTGLDNTMSAMLGALKNKKGLLKTMNKFALGTVPAVIGVGALQEKKQGGSTNDYINAYLTEDEINEYRKGGYIVEDDDDSELEQAQKGIISTKEHTDKKGNKTIVVTKDDGTRYTKVIGKDGKVYNKTTPGMSPYALEQAKKQGEWNAKSSDGRGEADGFWQIPIGIGTSGVKLGVGLAKGIAESSLAQATKAGSKVLFNTSIKNLPGANLKNSINAWFVGSGVNEYMDENSDVRRSIRNAYDNPTGDNVSNAIYENTLNLLNFSGLNVGKNVKQLGKYAKNIKPAEYKNYYRIEPTTFKISSTALKMSFTE